MRELKSWRIIHQSTPYNYTDPSVLVVEAEGIEQALITAYDHLTRQGLALSSLQSLKFDLEPSQYHTHTSGDNWKRLDYSLLETLGWPKELAGDVHIRSINEHTAKPLGKVVA